MLMCLTVLAPAGAAAQPDAPQLEYEVSQISATAGGLYTYVPDHWGLLRVMLANPNDEPVEVTCATYFDSDTELQFGRSVWIPARARLRLVHPTWIPAAASISGTQLQFHTMVLPLHGSTEALIQDRSGKAQLAGTLRVTLQKPLTGIIGGQSGFTAANPHVVSAFDLVATARLEQGLSRQISHLDDQFLPPGDEGLDSLDSIIIDRKVGLGDLEGISAIRSWLYAGGRLWVMLDRSDPLMLETLLGDEWKGQVVDRVSLNNVHLESGVQGPPALRFDAEFEHPVDLVRIVADDAEVVFRANGWPAALRRRCGAGQLLVTTLGAEAWVHLRSSRDPPPPARDEPPTIYAPNRPLLELTSSFLIERPPAAVSDERWEDNLREYVGYEIPSRTLIVGLLTAFNAVLALAAVWFARTNRLAWLGVLGPALALTTGGILSAVGRTQQAAVQTTTALLQSVRPVPGTDAVHVTGLAGHYASTAGTADLAGTRGGWLRPDMSGMVGTTRRLIWSDLGQWHWEHLPEMPGLRQMSFGYSGATAERCEAWGTFDEAGVVGRLTLPPGIAAADALLATRAGRISVELEADGAFRAAANRVMAGDQFLGADLFSDEQNRRARVLAELLRNPPEQGFPHVPTLFFWTPPWETGIHIDDHLPPVGAALVAMPLMFERPPSGTSVTIPSPLVTYREAVGPDGSAPVGLFNNRTGAWEEKSAPSSTWIAVQIPAELRPLNVQEARVTVHVSGPVGRLEIAGFDHGAVTAVQNWVDPVGTLTVAVRESELLQPVSAGVIPFRISGGDPDRPELTHPGGELSDQTSYWKIESLDVEIRATVVDAPPLE